MVDLLLPTHFLWQAIYCSVANPFILWAIFTNVTKPFAKKEDWQQQTIRKLNSLCWDISANVRKIMFDCS
jgi:hypothetical protein